MKTEVIVCVCEFHKAAVGAGREFIEFAHHVLVASLYRAGEWLEPWVVAQYSKFLFHIYRVITVLFSFVSIVLGRVVVGVLAQAVPYGGAQRGGVLPV